MGGQFEFDFYSLITFQKYPYFYGCMTIEECKVDQNSNLIYRIL